MKTALLSSALLLSFSSYASQISTEPQVNFAGQNVGITKTCLTEDGHNLMTKSAVKTYALVERAGKTVSTYTGKKILTTSLNYIAQGACVRKGVKGICTQYAPSTSETYDLSGTFEVSQYRTVAGKIRVKASSEIVHYNVESCY